MIGAPDAFASPGVDWWALTPQLVLVGAALGLLLVTSLSPRTLPAGLSTTLSVAAAAAAGVVSWALWNDVRTSGPRVTLADAIVVDGFGLFFTLVVCAALVVTLLVAHGYATREGLAVPELGALALASAVGAIVMATANDLVVLFLGLETLSIALYVMIALHVQRSASREGAAKYFVLGAASSAFLLYGIALIYGAAGSTNVSVIARYLDDFVLRDEHLLTAGAALLVVGLAFKVAAVPFHMWAPDVYQGAPSPIAGYLASVAKAAGFAALVRVLYRALGTHEVVWTPLLTGLAYASVIAGSVLAICQRDVKRMLAYSSVSHAGFVLIGVQSGLVDGVGSALAYLLFYAFMVIGSFAVVGAMRPLAVDSQSNDHDLARYAGLARTRPVLALGFAVLLFAQAGVPLTSGFIAKFGVIAAAVTARSYVLAAVAMLAAVVGAFAYLRVVLAMYAPDDASESSPDASSTDAPPRVGSTSRIGVVALGICVTVTLVAGVLPEPVLRFAHDAVQFTVW